jgi:hypothetical protein
LLHCMWSYEAFQVRRQVRVKFCHQKKISILVTIGLESGVARNRNVLSPKEKLKNPLHTSVVVWVRKRAMIAPWHETTENVINGLPELKLAWQTENRGFDLNWRHETILLCSIVHSLETWVIVKDF